MFVSGYVWVRGHRVVVLAVDQVALGVHVSVCRGVRARVFRAHGLWICASVPFNMCSYQCVSKVRDLVHCSLFCVAREWACVGVGVPFMEAVVYSHVWASVRCVRAHVSVPLTVCSCASTGRCE